MISVCILIKNEEDVLDECLKSIYEISDEIIIIDNGSTDNSIKIAKNYNCKIFYDYGQSFDEIRNKFFKLASHEWILSLDADERLQVKNINIKEELSYISNECKGIFIPRLDYIGKGKWAQNKFLRLYRNSSLLKYSNVKIHSSLKPSINRVNGSIKNLDGIFIHHFDNIYKKKNYKKRTFYKEELLIQINNQNISNTEKYSYLCFLGLEYVYEKKFNSKIK